MEDQSGVYLAALVVNWILAFVTLYLLLALCFFEYSTTYFNNRSSRGLYESHNKISRTLRGLTISGSVFAFVHNVCEIVAHFLKDTHSCQTMGVMWLLTYALGVLCVYVFLWQRQRWLYESPGLKHLLSRCVKVFAWIVLFFLVISAIMIFLAGSRMIFFSSCGSNPDQAKMHLYNIILSVILLVLTLAGQTQLLILFIIPLRSHVQKTKKSFDQRISDAPSSATTEMEERHCSSAAEVQVSRRNTKKKDNAYNGIMQLVRRCLILATLNMVGDIVAALVTILVENASGKIIYDVNLLFSVLYCIGSFKTWRQMIFPWKRTKSEQQRQERINAINLNTSLTY